MCVGGGGGGGLEEVIFFTKIPHLKYIYIFFLGGGEARVS